MNGQCPVARHATCEKTLLFSALTPRHFRALGYLAARGRLDAGVPPDARDAFESRYQAETGADAACDHANYFRLQDRAMTTPELRVYFPTPEAGLAELDFGAGVDVADSPHRTGEHLIGNNDFWWRLVAIGFKLGNRQDRQRIRNNMPGENRADYDAGLIMEPAPFNGSVLEHMMAEMSAITEPTSSFFDSSALRNVPDMR